MSSHSRHPFLSVNHNRLLLAKSRGETDEDAAPIFDDLPQPVFSMALWTSGSRRRTRLKFRSAALYLPPPPSAILWAEHEEAQEKDHAQLQATRGHHVSRQRSGMAARGASAAGVDTGHRRFASRFARGGR